jgi:uncharacterized protein YhfF
MTGIPFDLPLFELAYPGPLRDELVATALSGAKTSTSSLLDEYAGEDAPLPVAGQRYVLVDSNVRAVGLVEVTEVRTLPLNEVDLEFAREEGEGYESVAAWRRAHERFWKTNAPGITLETPRSWSPSGSASSSVCNPHCERRVWPISSTSSYNRPSTTPLVSAAGRRGC